MIDKMKQLRLEAEQTREYVVRISRAGLRSSMEDLADVLDFAVARIDELEAKNAEFLAATAIAKAERTSLKPGDKVVCVNDRYSTLTAGEAFVVEACQGNSIRICIRGICQWWIAERFRPVEPPKPTLTAE